MTTINSDITVAEHVIARPDAARRLDELELDDSHRHEHVESEVLVPAVLARERRPTDAASADPADQGGEAPCWAHLFDGA